MTKGIIFLPCTSKYAPAKQGDFLWSEKHQKHIWEGRELEPEEFNRVIDRIMEDGQNLYLYPTCRILVEEEPPKPARKTKCP